MIKKKDTFGNLTYIGKAEPGTYPLNCEPDAPISGRWPNFRFRQAQERFGVHDSSVAHELGWANDRYYTAVRTEQPSNIEDIMVRAVLEAARRCPGNSRFMHPDK